MKRSLLLAVILVAPVAAWLLAEARPPESVRYGSAQWQPETLGNHRAVVRVAQAAPVVTVHIPWRRRDKDAQAKNIIVTDGAGQQIKNVVRLEVSRAAADLAFEPSAGPGDYFVYYLPNTGAGRANYPKIAYPPFQDTADRKWVARNHLGGADIGSNAWRTLLRADVVEIQSNGEFDGFSPMELTATDEEMKALLDAHRETFLLFSEDRRYPIRMTDDLPVRWIEAGPGRPFHGEAARGEFYAFQVGVFAARQRVQVLDVRLSPLEGPGGRRLDKTSFRCINLGGVDSSGARFTRRVVVDKGKVQALWCGLQVSSDAEPGEYRGRVTVGTADAGAQSVNVIIAVDATLIKDAGDDDPWRESRLRWLDSTLAQDDDVVRPYTPITVEGHTLGVLGRKVTLDTSGLPARLQSYFAPEMTRLSSSSRDVLASPIDFHVELAGATTAACTNSPLRFLKRSPGTVSWQTQRICGPVRIEFVGQMEFDGTVDYQVTLAATESTALLDVVLEIPIARPVAKYMMGMGLKGGFRPADFNWKWDVQRPPFRTNCGRR